MGRQPTIERYVEEKLALGYFICAFHFSLSSHLSTIAPDPITFSWNESCSLNFCLNKLPFLSHLVVSEIQIIEKRQSLRETHVEKNYYED